MIDLNSTQRTSDNANPVSTVSVKSVVADEKEIKGTELAGRGPVNVEKAQNNDTQNKEDLFAEVKQNLDKLNEFIPLTSTNLIFEFDEVGEPPIIKVLDKESEEVIREIPTEEFREVAKALEEFADKLTNKGFLFNKTA